MAAARRLLRDPVVVTALVVWTAWLAAMTSGDRWHLFAEGWPMSITMAFGSFVAGATSEGGGAVAFPVMTLLLGIDPTTARDFSLMIQTIGMNAAAIAIVSKGIRIERKAVVFGGIGDLAEAKFQPVDQRFVAFGGGGFGVEVIGGGVGVIAQLPHQRLVGVPGVAL